MYLLHKGIKNPQFNYSTAVIPTKKLRLDPNRYILELLNKPNTTENEPEPVK